MDCSYFSSEALYLFPLHHQYKLCWLWCKMFSKFLFAETVVSLISKCLFIKGLWAFNILHKMFKLNVKSIWFFESQNLLCYCLTFLFLSLNYCRAKSRKRAVRVFWLVFCFIPCLLCNLENIHLNSLISVFIYKMEVITVTSQWCCES